MDPRFDDRGCLELLIDSTCSWGSMPVSALRSARSQRGTTGTLLGRVDCHFPSLDDIHREIFWPLPHCLGSHHGRSIVPARTACFLTCRNHDWTADGASIP